MVKDVCMGQHSRLSKRAQQTLTGAAVKPVAGMALAGNLKAENSQ